MRTHEATRADPPNGSPTRAPDVRALGAAVVRLSLAGDGVARVP